MNTVYVPSTFVVISDLVVMEFGPGCSLPVVCDYGHSHVPSVIVERSCNQCVYITESMVKQARKRNKDPSLIIPDDIALLKDQSIMFPVDIAVI